MSERRFPAPAPHPASAAFEKKQRREPSAAHPPADRRPGKAPEGNIPAHKDAKEHDAPPQSRGQKSYGKPSFKDGGPNKGRERFTSQRRECPNREHTPDAAPAYENREDAPEDNTIMPGLKPVLELLEADPSRVDAVFLRKGRKGKETDRILDICRSAGVRFTLADDTLLNRMWAGNHQGVIARLFTAGFADLDTALEAGRSSPLGLLLAMDQVQDPGNVGALARTLYAFGGGGILVPRHNGAYLGAGALKSSAGALANLAVAKVPNLGQALDEAADAGFTIYGASSATADDGHGIPVHDIFSFVPDKPAILVLGSEEDGLRQGIAKRCQAFLRIPLARDFDSLNVAQAGAIIMARFAALNR